MWACQTLVRFETQLKEREDGSLLLCRPHVDLYLVLHDWLLNRVVVIYVVAAADLAIDDAPSAAAAESAHVAIWGLLVVPSIDEDAGQAVSSLNKVRL